MFDPTSISYSWEVDYYKSTTPFWLKMPDFSKKKMRKRLDVNDPDVTWAARIRTLASSPQLDSVRVLKNTKPPVMQVLLDRFGSDRRYRAENSLGERLSFAERKKMISSVDTIFHIGKMSFEDAADSVFRYSPESYRDSLEIRKTTVRAEDIARLRLDQIWYWDERANRLVIRLESFAPMKAPPKEWFWRIQPAEKPLFFRRLR